MSQNVAAPVAHAHYHAEERPDVEGFIPTFNPSLKYKCDNSSSTSNIKVTFIMKRPKVISCADNSAC